MAADRASWPLGRGFDRWYGFHGGETHQFVPSLYCDNHSVRPPRTVAEGYHLTEDLADRAIEYLNDLRNVDAEQPFFLYFATGACHSPHHAPPEWIERYRGQFDDGWDALRDRVLARQLETGVLPPGTELSPRPPWVPAWDELASEDRAVAARFMECFAGFLSHTDAQIGRLLEHLEATGDADDTLVILVSDNGASAEGGPHGSINDVRLVNLDPAGPEELRARIDELGGPSVHNNYPWGWTMAGNTPFKRWKREVHEGGVADPCIVRWPTRYAGDAGKVRRQFVHAIDVFPTVLELVAVEAPDAPRRVGADPDRGHQLRLPPRGRRRRRAGASHHAALRDARVTSDLPRGLESRDVQAARADRRRTEPLRSAVRRRRVGAVPRRRRHVRGPRPCRGGARTGRGDGRPLVATRPSVTTCSRSTTASCTRSSTRAPSRLRERTRYRYGPDGAPVPESVAVDTRNRSHAITVTVDVPEGVTPNGVLLAIGCVLGGWSLHVLDGRVRYVHNLYGKQLDVTTSDVVIGAGRHTLGFAYERTTDDGGTTTLLVDGEVVGRGEIPKFTPTAFNNTNAGLTCGYELGPPVGEGYEAPFRFTGSIAEAVVEVTGAPRPDPLAEFERIMAEQ